MLRELRVADFAIVDEVRVEFEPGLTVLTGETGAGKSILVEALDLALGGRSSEEMIRAGAESAVVEARFDIGDAPALGGWLDEQGFESADEILIKRVISRSGKNRCYINGGMATVAQVRAAGEMLVDVHGQHEHQTLLDPKAHLPFLDAFLGLDAEGERFRKKLDEYGEARRRLHALLDNQKEVEQRMDLLKFQIGEISAAALEPGEDEALSREKARLANAERLIELAAEASAAMDEGDQSASALVRAAIGAIERMAQVDGSLAPVLETLTGAAYQLDEAAAQARRYAESLERDPERLAFVDDRLDLIRGLKKKYGETVEEIIAHGERAAAELSSMEFDRDNMDRLKAEETALGGEAARLALALDSKRREGAKKFAKAVEKELSELNMGRARIEPFFTYDEDPQSPAVLDGRGVKIGRGGIGSMEMLFSSNPGEPPRPFAKIASGGEISRLMLALKTVISGRQPTPVMIFDEIDAGIGGVTADRIGEKMKKLADGCQVFCITHLPQVARQAHAHILVEKVVKKGRTGAMVERLGRQGRIAELARMAGGGTAKDSAIKWAEEALDQG